MKKLAMGAVALLVTFCFSSFAQEREEYFHGSAILTQVDQVWEIDHWNTIETPVIGAVTVTRVDHDYGSQIWCPEHWSIQFTPSYGIDQIRDVEIIASPNSTSDNYAEARVVDSNGKALQPPGGHLYILSDRFAKVYMLITPSDPTVRAILNPALGKYQVMPYFMYGFTMRRIGDYLQIDLRNRCTVPPIYERGVSR